jgi:hypothetical protein
VASSPVALTHAVPDESLQPIASPTTAPAMTTNQTSETINIATPYTSQLHVEAIPQQSALSNAAASAQLNPNSSPALVTNNQPIPGNPISAAAAINVPELISNVYEEFAFCELEMRIAREARERQLDDTVNDLRPIHQLQHVTRQESRWSLSKTKL